MLHTPLDAVPDISDVQVIVATEWMGRSPDLVEDQVTYPLVTALLSTPHVKAVAASPTSASRTSTSSSRTAPTSTGRAAALSSTCRASAASCPTGVNPTMGPDATGVGWVFQYALVDDTGRHTLADLRSFQDWYLRYWLASVPGVAEVASIGGFVKQYQVTPRSRAARVVSTSARKTSSMAIQASNNDVEGRLLEFSGREYMVRGRGYLKSIDDIEQVAMRAAERARHAGARRATWRRSPSGRTCGGAWRSSTARARPSAASSSCASARTRSGSSTA